MHALSLGPASATKPESPMTPFMGHVATRPYEYTWTLSNAAILFATCRSSVGLGVPVDDRHDGLRKRVVPWHLGRRPDRGRCGGARAAGQPVSNVERRPAPHCGQRNPPRRCESECQSLAVWIGFACARHPVTPRASSVASPVLAFASIVHPLKDLPSDRVYAEMLLSCRTAWSTAPAGPTPGPSGLGC